MTMNALIVEDDRSWQQILTELLNDAGLTVDVTDNLDTAAALLRAKPHRLALVDLSLNPEDHENRDGLHVLEAVRRLDPGCQAILLTGYATVELAVSALTEFGAFTFLRKESFQRAQFRSLVNRALASAPLAANPTDETPSIDANPPTEAGSRQEMLRALVVEDDAGWRSILSELLSDAGYEARLASSFGEAAGYLRREKYALAVMDLSLSGNWNSEIAAEELDGYQLLNSTRVQGIPTIVVSGVATPEDIQKVYDEQDIFAYLEKQAFDRTVFRRLLEEIRSSHKVSSELDALTGREQEVLDLLAQGWTNKEIAERLVITNNTVKRHLKAIFEKLGVHTRSAAAAKAVEVRGDK